MEAYMFHEKCGKSTCTQHEIDKERVNSELIKLLSYLHISNSSKITVFI